MTSETKTHKTSVEHKKEKKISELQIAKNEVKELTETLQRLQAEFENFKKRTQNEMSQCIKRSNRELIKNLLPVYDDFMRAIKQNSTNENHASEDDGLNHIFAKFQSILHDEGIHSLEAKNTIFNPKLHEALMVEPTNEKKKDNTVLEVFEEGFMLKDEIIRHSKVKVAKYQQNTNDN
jgi:molecular chaperone GrpE